MHDLKTNFLKMLGITNTILAGKLNMDGNLHFYPRKPKLPDSHIIALSLCQECLGIDSENWFMAKLRSDYKDDFRHLVHITNYNKRRKRLARWTEQINCSIAGLLNEGEDVYMVDSIPVPVCKLAREKQLKACRHDFQTAPDKGYSAVYKQYYIGYKLHLTIGMKGVYQGMELTKASVHDVHYLNEVKHSGLHSCLLLGDKGYVSTHWQSDLFASAGIKLQTPKRGNQKHCQPWPFVFKSTRRRIEVVFAQLCDQMMLKRNYAKTFLGLRTRVMAKVTAVTVLQYVNYQNGKPINHIKHALAA
ncbi:MAG: IS982 family transposase [Sphingobacteriaceae bacterium]|nr:MAG: IS982 family transposase [Sphingobacteriaceae bacterium]